jgi:cytochrome c oxidase cbb3-type subunit III
VTRAGRLLAIAMTIGLIGCEREERRLRETPPLTTAAPAVVPLTRLVPGLPGGSAAPSDFYEENAYAVAEGKRLYTWYNCVGCHARGGGGMGPALMDDEWIYGSEPENVVATILGGRPNGMPAFQGKIPPYQAWQLAAYVRSMSGLIRKDVRPGRDDHMQVKEQEQGAERARPKQTNPADRP